MYPLLSLSLSLSRDRCPMATGSAWDTAPDSGNGSRTRHPDGARFSGCPHRPRSRFSFRLGGDCGGGLPACPSGLLKPAGRFRESAGYWVLWDLGFLTPSSPAFWAAGTQWRPGDPASHHRRGRAWERGEGCDHADGAPAACLVAGRADRVALSGGARSAFVLGGPLCREVVPAQMRTRHPGGARFSACPHRPRSRFSFRLGGDCGGGLPACPSGLLKPAGRFRESAGYWVLWDLGFLTPSSPAFWAAVTLLASRRPSVAPSAWSRVGEMGGLRPRRWRAGGLPRSRESGPRRASRGSPVGICAGRAAPPGGRPGTNADPAPRWGAVFRVSPSASVPVFFQVGRRLWGRASSLPVRVVEAGRAFPRECGVLGLVGSRVPDTLVPGLLGRRDALASRRPSVAPSAWSRVG